MKSIFFLILLCLPMASFADMPADQIVKGEEDNDCLASCYHPFVNTEIIEVPQSVTGENTQKYKVTDHLKPKNDGIVGGSSSMTLNRPHEVGWQS